jgi:tRNA (guanosine-2'-O-)-methyltransferase
VTRGCERWLDVAQYSEPAPCVAALKDAGYTVLAAMPGAALALDTIDVAAPGARVAVAFGNENLGLSPTLLDLVDGTFTIPMYGASQSLNVSVSAAVTMHALASARRRALGRDTDLSEAQVMALRARYYADEVPAFKAVVERFIRERAARILAEATS